MDSATRTTIPAIHTATAIGTHYIQSQPYLYHHHHQQQQQQNITQNMPATAEMDDVSVDDYTTAQPGGILSKLFRSCAAEPRGSVHRAWGISLLFVVLYFIMSVLESEFC